MDWKQPCGNEGLRLLDGGPRMCKDPVAGKSCTRENMEATEASVGESRVRRRERWGGEVGKEREEGKREIHQISIPFSSVSVGLGYGHLSKLQGSIQMERKGP